MYIQYSINIRDVTVVRLYILVCIHPISVFVVHCCILLVFKCKGKKTPHPLTKDTVLWHTGSNVIGFISGISIKKEENLWKQEKSHASVSDIIWEILVLFDNTPLHWGKMLFNLLVFTIVWGLDSQFSFHITQTKTFLYKYNMHHSSICTVHWLHQCNHMIPVPFARN